MNDIEQETQRVMKQMLSLSALSPEELEERRREFLAENYEPRERTDAECHSTYRVINGRAW